MELIRTELTPKERLKLYSQGKTVDRMPVSLTASETAPPMYGIPISKYYFSSEYMVQVETKLWEDFQADSMGMGLGLRTLVEALGTKLKYPNEGLSYIDEPFIKDYRQLDNLELVDINKDGRFPIIVEAFQILIEKFGKDHIISTGMAGPLTTATGLCGTEKFLKDSIKNKDSIHKLLRYTTDCIIHCAKSLNEKLGISVSLSEPMASKDIISLKQFREIEKPYLIEIVQSFKKFQGAPSIHICGHTKDRWQDIVDIGVSGFSVDNCENMSELKQAHGKELSISGNVAPVDILKNGNHEEIDEEVKRCILEAADSPGGFTLSPGCTIPARTPKDNIVTMMNAATFYGRNAIKGKKPQGIVSCNY